MMARRQRHNPISSLRIVIALTVAIALLSAVAATLAPASDQLFGGRGPKIALPTLTCVAPNCTPTSKSALIPIESI